MSENEPEEKSTAYWPTGFSTVLEVSGGIDMKILRRVLGIIIVLLFTITNIQVNVHAEGTTYSIKQPVVTVKMDSESFGVYWTITTAAQYYLVQVKPSTSTEWKSDMDHVKGPRKVQSTAVDGGSWGDSFTPAAADRELEYDFRVFACDENGNQQSDMTVIEKQKLYTQDSAAVYGVTLNKYYAGISAALNAGNTSVKLMKDLNETVSIGSSQSNTITIDLNDRTWTSTSGLALENYGKCIIQDTGTNQTGVITSDNSTTPVWNDNVYNADGSTQSIATMTINSGTIRRATDGNGNAGNITTLRNCGILNMTGGTIDGGTILTGWEAPYSNGSTQIATITPLDYEVTTLGSQVVLKDATLTVWPHGLLKNSVVDAKVNDISNMYVLVDSASVTSSDSSVKAAAAALVDTYKQQAMFDTAAMQSSAPEGAEIYPDVTVTKAETNSSSAISVLALDISAMAQTVDDATGKASAPTAVEPQMSVSMKVALPDEFEGADGDAITVRHTMADGTVKEYSGKVVAETVDGVTKKYAEFDNPDGFSTFEIVKKEVSVPAEKTGTSTASASAKGSSSSNSAVKTGTVSKNFLITYLDCKGNTVSVQWVPYGGSASAPAGYTYPDVVNVSSHQDIKPISCKVSAKFIVPNTADKK